MDYIQYMLFGSIVDEFKAAIKSNSVKCVGVCVGRRVRVSKINNKSAGSRKTLSIAKLLLCVAYFGIVFVLKALNITKQKLVSNGATHASV